MAVIFFVLVVSMLTSCRGDINASDYVYWKKADISAWNQYFPGRALEEERQTNYGAVVAVKSVSVGLEESLRKVVYYQAQELETAQLMMEGTSAQGCVLGITNYMDNAIVEEISAYEDCTADALPKLNRIYNSWEKTNGNYQSVYQKSLDGIDKCAKTYPNKDSLFRLISCVDSWNNNYFTFANRTLPRVFDSPSMKVFTDTVVTCAQKAAQGILSKGWKFLEKLVQCAKISENIDSLTYEAEVNQEFSNYLTEIDLLDQTNIAQNSYSTLVGQIEQKMLFYYNLQKVALEKYVIESRGPNYYYNQIYGILHNYFSTVSATSLDNPSNVQCVSDANALLTGIVCAGSASALQCDQDIVEKTKLLISQVNNDFAIVNMELPNIGNAAILSCFSNGYIFAEHTIINCFNLTLSSFNVNAAEVNARIIKDVSVWLGYEKSFFSTFSLPCGDSILSRAYLGAEQALYELQRCLYINSGTKYAVTTSSPIGGALPYYTDVNS